ncbi:hypothetical protein [Bordetella genomosp. 1]|uniref:Lipoprotein n=1 Tax=Bordetella genomosp. 1 TaxID=1395607 RepID=A0ABX4EYF6_9BORD|nr:hypothetical protein [Bordetella genomosp. 1]OZI58447.1 hypothetical protein CAL27_17270 [Bordetella genomosp. 1]
MTLTRMNAALLRTVLALAALLCAFNAAHAARPSVPMDSFVGNRIETASGKPPSPEQIQVALKRAGMVRDWVVTPNADGTYRAHLTIRKHTLDVQIRVADGTFDITYLASTNLGYGPNREDAARPLIHPAYNTWVKNLVGDIRREFALL